MGRFLLVANIIGMLANLEPIVFGDGGVLNLACIIWLDGGIGNLLAVIVGVLAAWCVLNEL